MVHVLAMQGIQHISGIRADVYRIYQVKNKLFYFLKDVGMGVRGEKNVEKS